jgi:hypothetical protein
MKITKARLLQIIREEVELHEKYVEENVIELDEEAIEELSKQAGKKAIEDEIDTDKETGSLKEVEKVKHKGKEYKASASTMKAIRGGAGGPGKVTTSEFEKAVKQASWADDPEAVAAAGRIVAKKKAGTMEEDSDVDEDKLLDPETKEPVNGTKPR